MKKYTVRLCMARGAANSGEYRWDSVGECDTWEECREILEEKWKKDRGGNILESGIRENGTGDRWHQVERPAHFAPDPKGDQGSLNSFARYLETGSYFPIDDGPWYG